MELSRNVCSSLINFFHPVLRPSITCSSLGAEDHPVENLISSDCNKLNRGFICYLSKPPISLNIKLMCPIRIVSIKIWPEVGSLKSTVFDISTMINGHNEKIACCDNLTNENIVMFCRLNDSTVNSTLQLKKCFFFRNFRNTAKVDQFTICIWKTKNSSVPVIKRIEVWGQMPEKCPLNEEVLQLWQSRDGSFSHSKQSAPHRSNDDATTDEVVPSGMEIPDELLDAITHQIMTVPMTLPSGKTVDQSTIEKFNKMESTWGREPSDPFTGMVFTNNRKPIFNSALKSSIDILLTKYPNALETNNVPRTIGTVNGIRKRPATSMDMSTCDDSSRRLKYFESSLNGIDVSESSTKYLQRPKCKESERISCYKCQSVKELYRIKVCEKHFICRSCLFKIDFNKFSGECRCHKQFSRIEVEKYYSSSKAFNYRLS